MFVFKPVQVLETQVLWERSILHEQQLLFFFMQIQALVASHRFIATALFRVAKNWPHSPENISEWPLTDMSCICTYLLGGLFE